MLIGHRRGCSQRDDAMHAEDVKLPSRQGREEDTLNLPGTAAPIL